ncbi:hypothetical protein C7N43_13100 [Sphingobacteriales bacterium UPWRP_1]|nr:hypothetical protein BVG80_14610 [Sphingobacteriales bacterium TSM_CSM]PSJ76545.1 hypothetical protein C7N43_13100 [Sphingobacteriales bacterium UPWRP_1]
MQVKYTTHNTLRAFFFQNTVFCKTAGCFAAFLVTIQVLSVNSGNFSCSLLIGSIDHKEQKNFAVK